MAVAHTNIGTGAAKVYCHEELTIGSLTQSRDTITWARLGVVKDQSCLVFSIRCCQLLIGLNRSRDNCDAEVLNERHTRGDLERNCLQVQARHTEIFSRCGSGRSCL